MTSNIDNRLLRLREEAQNTRRNLARKRTALDSILQELGLLQEWSELASSRSDLPKEANNILKLDSDRMLDRDIVRFKISASISERERLEKSLKSEIGLLENSLKAISKCPQCMGNGKIVQHTSYERLEEGRIIQTREELDCDLCRGTGVLELDDAVGSN